MTTVREFTQILLALPADQQDLPFVTCLGYSAECYLEAPSSVYAQPETRFVGIDGTRPVFRTTGAFQHVRPTDYLGP